MDNLHRNGYYIIQDPKRFCFGIDAVILSGFTEVKRNETVLDIGTGTGIIPILLEAKTEGIHFTGLEIQPESVEMARRSILINSLENKITVDEGDIKNFLNIYKPSSFDVITSNPPYMNDGGGIKNEYSPKAIARHEILCSLEDIVYAVSKLLKFNGRFYMVHRPHRLVDIITTLRNYKLEPKKIRFVHSNINKEPSMVLIEALKGGKSMIKVFPPLIIYNENGKYTEEIYNIYYN